MALLDWQLPTMYIKLFMIILEYWPRVTEKSPRVFVETERQSMYIVNEELSGDIW